MINPVYFDYVIIFLNVSCKSDCCWQLIKMKEEETLVYILVY